VANGVKEEEARGDRGLDEHDDAGGDDGEQADDVHGANAVEDDVARAGEGLGGEGHFVSRAHEGGARALQTLGERREVVGFDGNVEKLVGWPEAEEHVVAVCLSMSTKSR